MDQQTVSIFLTAIRALSKIDARITRITAAVDRIEQLLYAGDDGDDEDDDNPVMDMIAGILQQQQVQQEPQQQQQVQQHHKARFNAPRRKASPEEIRQQLSALFPAAPSGPEEEENA